MMDDINHPAHYTQGKIETIDFIEDLPYNEGAAIKYIVRYKYKGTPLKDLLKARWYVDRLIQNERERQREEKGVGSDGTYSAPDLDSM